MSSLTLRSRLSDKRAAKIAAAGHDIWGSDSDDGQQVAFIHAMNAHVYYPRSRTDARVHRHETGRALLSIQAGDLVNPKTRKWEEQPLPFGIIPRALQVYIATQAIRQRSPEIEIRNSLTDFVRTIEGSVSGGKRGNMVRWKEQLRAS